MGTLIVNLLAFYALLILVNIPAPFLGLVFEADSGPKLWYQPPGWVIPLVWFILFTLLAIARTQLLQLPHPQGQGWIGGLAFLCATYAYYTLGLAKWTGISPLWFGLLGNLAVIVFAAWVVYKLQAISLTAALLTAPVIVWTVYASLIVLGEMNLHR